jgi:hypothetical protein
MTPVDSLIKDNNMISWLETEALKGGTPNQRERWGANLLPDDELLKLARAELFAGFEKHKLDRWHNHDQRKYLRASLRHKQLRTHCTADEGTLPEYELADVAELEAHQWDRLKTIQAEIRVINGHPWMFHAKQQATVESFTLWATCPRCEVEDCRSYSKVSIPWAGRVLVREFVL